MAADFAPKLLGRPLCGTTECETGLFRQQAHKTPFYKHYLQYKFLKLYELLMFLEFLVMLCHDFALGQVKARNYFVCILSKIFSTINHTFFYFTC